MKLAKGLSLPPEAVTQTFGILAAAAGKSASSSAFKTALRNLVKNGLVDEADGRLSPAADFHS